MEHELAAREATRKSRRIVCRAKKEMKKHAR